LIPYGRQDINQQDIDAVVDVLTSDFITQGPTVPLFEEKLKEFCGSKYAIASNSATSSLHAACYALGVSVGDEVWTSPNTFVASANCALYCGAKIDFVDIDSKTYNLSPEKLEEKLKIAKRRGKIPKVVIPVHLTGQSCDMKKIFQLSQEYGFKIIEDASHAIGAKYFDENVGSCKYSDITVFSFHPVKIITTAEGGIATTNQKSLAEKLDLFRSHGITKNKNFLKNNNDGPWYYEQIDIGYNYRMTDIHAALGISQINRIKSIIEKRHSIADRYSKELNGIPIFLPWQDPNQHSSFHLYVIRLDIKKASISHKDFFIKMRESNILVNLHYIPVYFHPYYQKLGFEKGYCIEAENYYKSAVSIPIFPTLSNDDQSMVIETIKSLIK
jgi:UDP-4-amino-4,6-dideoxy-N-acetyl-beta-L-altrosamine transaminase